MTTEDQISRHVVVHGEVQGVFFRESVRERADLRGVAGWVRNNPDGTVEAVFEGPSTAVEELVEFSRSGPDGAQVARVETNEQQPEGFTGFEVR